MPVAGFADDTLEEESEGHDSDTVEVSGNVLEGIRHLLEIADPKSDTAFDPDLVQNVIAFSRSPKKESALYHLGKLRNNTTVYHEFDIATSLRRILQIAFNPNFPASVVTPSSVRVAYFPDTGKGNNHFPELWKISDNKGKPIIARALEYNENTPDRNSGTYHSYELDRTLILWQHTTGNTLISLSKQRGKSATGKKGYVLGPEDDWNFFYSGVEGSTMSGLGWVKSHIYDSFSVIVYHEDNEKDGKLDCSVFKGLRAGWAGINMVRKRHMLDGIRQWEKDMKTVFESELPFGEMAGFFKRIDRLSTEELKGILDIYIEKLNSRFGDVKIIGKKLSEFTEKKEYVAGIGNEEIRMIIVLEYMKSHLGRKPLLDMRKIFDKKNS